MWKGGGQKNSYEKEIHKFLYIWFAYLRWLTHDSHLVSLWGSDRPLCNGVMNICAY